jgi:aerotaxis receptor
MTDVGARIGEIDDATSAIQSAIEQQAAATQEITRNVTETASSAQEVSSKIQSVSTGAAKVGSQAANGRQSISEITNNLVGLQAALVGLFAPRPKTQTDPNFSDIP